MTFLDKHMDWMIRGEEVVFFGFSIYLFSLLGYAWWLFPLLLFTPDLSMLGYAVNPKVGSVVYNVIHHRGLSVLLYLLGVLVASPVLMLVTIILFAHSTMDRVMGYGLKYSDAFKHTHLGTMS